MSHKRNRWPSMHWRCWLGDRKGTRPVKTEWWGAGVVSCLERCADLHTAQLMPLPLTVSCFSKMQTGFTFLVPAHPGSPRQRAVKWVHVWREGPNYACTHKCRKVWICGIFWHNYMIQQTNTQKSHNYNTFQNHNDTTGNLRALEI